MLNAIPLPSSSGCHAIELFIFFVSSRRRHTRSKRDWSSGRVLFRSDADDVARWTKRRPLAELTWRIESAPTERERLRALTALASRDVDEAHALAYANGWDRRLVRDRKSVV